MINLIFLGLMAVSPGETMIKSDLDELYASFLLSSATIEEKTLVTFIGSTSIDLVLIDLKKNSVHFIKDGRIPQLGIYTLNTVEDRFVVLENRFTPQSKMIQLTKEGEFIQQTKFSQLKNFPKDIQFGVATALPKGNYLVTYQTHANSEQTFLGKIDNEANAFEILQVYPKEEDKNFIIVCVQDQFLKLEMETGKIVLLNKHSFQEEKCLRKADPLVEKDNPLMSRYKGTVNTVINLDHSLSILWFNHFKNGEVLSTPIHEVFHIAPDLSFSKSSEFILSQYSGKTLSLSIEDGEFRVQ
ncbi:MAG: hypothetical protein CSA81_00165 [Acidobacteria bacterium]|nr:MAG: hypothetical protein CSA81_00165 [Acidobacteriota bacterium]